MVCGDGVGLLECTYGCGWHGGCWFCRSICVLSTGLSIENDECGPSHQGGVQFVLFALSLCLDFVAKTAARIPAQRSIRGCVDGRALQPQIFDSRSFEARRGYCLEVRWLVLFVADPVLRDGAGSFWVFCHECCCSTRFLVTRWKSELDPVTQDLNLKN